MSFLNHCAPLTLMSVICLIPRRMTAFLITLLRRLVGPLRLAIRSRTGCALEGFAGGFSSGCLRPYPFVLTPGHPFFEAARVIHAGPEAVGALACLFMCDRRPEGFCL